jgi:hypothetical protein
MKYIKNQIIQNQKHPAIETGINFVQDMQFKIRALNKERRNPTQR